MNAFAIRDFGADFSVDLARDFRAQKTNDAPRADFERADRPSNDSDFDRALSDEVRDKPRAETPQRADDRAAARERAPERDVSEREPAAARDRAEIDAKAPPRERAQDQAYADAPADAGNAAPADKAPAKPQSGATQAKADTGDTAQSLLIETPTTIVVAPKPAAKPQITAQGEASDATAAAPDGKMKDTAQDGCALTPPIAPGADAAISQVTAAQADPQANAQAVSQSTIQAGAQDAALAALLAPQQAAQGQKPSSSPEKAADDSAAVEPALLGAPKAVKTPSVAAAASDAPSASSAETAPAGGFEAALAKQVPAPPKESKGQDAQQASNNQTAAAPASGTPQPAAQTAAKAQEAVAAKDGLAAPKAEAKADAPQQIQGAAPAHSAQRVDEQRPLGAPTTHTSANANAVAQNVVRFFRHADGGSARFEIRLDPVELGRVDARVEMNPDKTVSLTLSADRPETLQELMRGARELERQLTDSGVKLSDDGVKFRLNADAQNGQGWRGAQNENGAQQRQGRVYGETEQDASAPIAIKSWRAGGVDVWA